MKLFSGLRNLGHALDYHMDRHGVLLGNLANAETPDYRTKELVFEPLLEEAKMSGSAEGHLGTSGSEGGSLSYVVEEEAPTGVDGNGVRLEKAVSQIAGNRLRFETGIDVARRRLALLRYAANDGNG